MKKKTIRVQDIMRTHFGCIDRRETVRTALSMMQESNARALIVNKRDEEDELGIVVLADIAKLVLARDKSQAGHTGFTAHGYTLLRPFV